MDGASNTSRVTILGCGGSGGVPLIGNHWGMCDADEPRNRRTRASIHVQLDDVSIVVDTGPDFREQLNREGINITDCVLYTHDHSDHVNGIDDLRYMSIVMKEIIPTFGHVDTLKGIERRFHYLYEMMNPLYQPRLLARPFANADYNNIVESVFEQGEVNQTRSFKTMPLQQQHGKTFSIGYRFGDFAYSTDVSEMSDDVLQKLKGIKTWLVDCGQYGQDFIEVHPNLDRVKEWNEIVQAPRVILTHLPVKADYQTLINELPQGFEPAYDGLTIDINGYA